MFWVDIRDFGALGDGHTDTSAAIRKAIDVAAVTSRVVYIPPGTYLVKSTVKIEVDNLKIIGAPASVILEDVARPEDGFIPLLAQNPRTAIHNLSIQGITVRFAAAGPDSASGIQLNNCVDFCVEDVRIIGDGKGMNNSITDGIACSFPNSTGIFKNVVAAGLSKPGIYIADGHDIRLQGCVATGGYATRVLLGTEPLRVPGISIGNAANVTVANCQAHHNTGAGLHIASLGTTPPKPYHHIQVIGGHFHDNGTNGIVTGTSAVGVRGSGLQIIGANCSDNAAAGIEVTSALNVLVADCVASGNQSGIIIQDIAPGQGAQDQTARVTLRGCHLYDNDLYGVILRAANDVTVDACRIYHSIPGKQAKGLAIWHFGTPPTQKKNTRLRLVDVDFDTMTEPETPIEHLGGLDSAVEVGYYRLQSLTFDNPNGALYAPPGSEYTALHTGITYRKGNSFDDQNWVS
jgi:hypothetical protein